MTTETIDFIPQLNAARRICRILLRETDRDTLIRKICRALASEDMYGPVLIGLRGPGREIDAIACAGPAGEDLAPDALWTKDQLGDLLRKVGRACGVVEIGENGTGMALPLIHEETLLGVMVLYTPARVPKEEGRLLLETGGDIAAGLFRIKAFERSRKTEADARAFLQIQDKMTSLGRVTAGIAHEIRNPLSGIYIYLKAVKQIYNQMGEIQRVLSIADKIEQAAGKIESIVQRVMDFSKPSRPKFAMVDVNRLLEDVSQLVVVSLRKRHIRLSKAFSEDLPLCRAEPQLIEQVVVNLVTNAAEAMADQSGEKNVTLSTGLSENRDSVLICVEDTGPGIDAERASHIFDPFYTTKNDSSGIGLSICRRIVDDHGGTLTVHAKPDQGGTRFVIALPLFVERTGQ